MKESDVKQTTLGGGCFWCLEAVYEKVQGVREVESGYAGGKTSDPSYREVCSGTTGHAEVVQVTFDPQEISFREILEIFFLIHDPTTLNRQGADVGTQYRSVIFYHDDEQKRIAEEMIDQLEREGAYSDPIVTELAPLPEYYPAEDYHQHYYEQNRNQPYCRFTIAPKLEKFRKTFARKVRD